MTEISDDVVRQLKLSFWVVKGRNCGRVSGRYSDVIEIEFLDDVVT